MAMDAFVYARQQLTPMYVSVERDENV